MAMHYEQDMNLREIGEVLGVGESRVCQLQQPGRGQVAQHAGGSLMDKLSIFGLLVALSGIVGARWRRRGRADAGRIP